MKNSLLFIFDEIWLKTMYCSTGYLARFWSNFKNSLKIQILLESAQIFYTTYKHLYVSENIIKMKISLLSIFDEIL